MQSLKFLLLIFLFNAHIAWAQGFRELTFKEEFPYSKIIKCNVLSPFMGTINLHCEIKNTINSSSQFEGYFFIGQIFGQSVPVKGLGVTYNYRYYLTGTFPTGFFVQPFIRYQQFNTIAGATFIRTTSATTNSTKLSVVGLGIVFGYQAVFFKRLSFDLYGGPVYNSSFIDKMPATANDVSPVFDGGWIRLRTTFGFIF